MRKTKLVADDVNGFTQHLGALLGRHAAEVPHFDELRERFAVTRERVECDVEFEQLDGRGADVGSHLDRLVERHIRRAAAAAVGRSCTGMVHQYASHRP